ncbi:hypothetical protein BS17DRAFT_711300 [Gyrodon lividus]|nr:hypothetical protein BS17DRAFT_711300 [Gyrodon lividus]
MAHTSEWKRVVEQAIVETGTRNSVPQKIYQPYTEADRLRYVRGVVLKATIFFCSNHSVEWGMSLEDALKLRLKHLKDKDEPMFIGCGPSISLRIQWPGYPAWTTQIRTMDFKNPKGPITKMKLAKNIANCVRRFIETMNRRSMEEDSDPRWKVGQRHIQVKDLILVSLHNVSKGSWQPQLRLR